MTVEEKAKKVTQAFERLISEERDAKVVKVLTDFLIEAGNESKALLHDIIRDVS